MVSMTGPSPIPGIGGTGGSCSSDQTLGNERQLHDTSMTYRVYVEYHMTDFAFLVLDTASVRHAVFFHVFFSPLNHSKQMISKSSSTASARSHPRRIRSDSANLICQEQKTGAFGLQLVCSLRLYGSSAQHHFGITTRPCLPIFISPRRHSYSHSIAAR